MSKQPSLVAKSHKVAELRKQGYKSLLEKYPHVRQRFIELWKQGGSYRGIRQQLVREFPEAEIPSHPSLKNYVDKHLLGTKGENAGKIIKVQPYTLDIDELLRELDPIVEFGKEIVPKAREEYENACTMKMSAKTRMAWFKLYADMIERYNRMLRTTKVGAMAMGELEDLGVSNAQVNNITFINNLSVDANKNNWKLAMKAYERLQGMAQDLRDKAVVEGEVVEKEEK